MSKPPKRVFDLIAYDQQDLPVLLVEVKRAGDIRTIERQLLDTAEYVDATRRHPRFFIIALPKELRLYRRDALKKWELAHVFDSTATLRVYDEQYGNEPVNETYLAALVEAWLSDLAVHWSNKETPGEQVFEQLDLLNDLRRGSTAIDAKL